MTFRLFLFADRDANRVTRLEQSQEKHAKNDFHGPAWKFQAWKYDCRYLQDHPGTNYVGPGYTVNPFGLEFLEKPFHTLMVALKELSCCQHCQNDQAANFHGGFLFYFLVSGLCF